MSDTKKTTRVQQRTTGETGTVIGTCERATYVLVRWDRGYACAERVESLALLEESSS
jgi:hypothetical protein